MPSLLASVLSERVFVSRTFQVISVVCTPGSNVIRDNVVHLQPRREKTIAFDLFAKFRRKHMERKMGMPRVVSRRCSVLTLYATNRFCLLM